MTIDEFIMLRYLNAVAVSGRNAMSNTTQFDLSYNRYVIEVLGITVEECESILEQSNGIMCNLTRPLPPLCLVTTLQAGAEASASDHATYGRDMSFPRQDSPEAPALLAKLAQKVSALEPWQQDAIVYYAAGFWGGINTAAREREELTISSNEVPQGWDKV